jgi:hypothetical protein
MGSWPEGHALQVLPFIRLQMNSWHLRGFISGCKGWYPRNPTFRISLSPELAAKETKLAWCEELPDREP